MTTESEISMDEAAKRASADLDKHFDTWTAKDVAVWWKTYYLTAGHKRLGRVLVEKGKS